MWNCTPKPNFWLRHSNLNLLENIFVYSECVISDVAWQPRRMSTWPRPDLSDGFRNTGTRDFSAGLIICDDFWNFVFSGFLIRHFVVVATMNLYLEYLVQFLQKEVLFVAQEEQCFSTAGILPGLEIVSKNFRKYIKIKVKVILEYGDFEPKKRGTRINFEYRWWG